jgi:thymidylate synthase
MNIEHDYLRLLKDILDNGKEKEDRTGTGTISVFGRQIRHKMNQGFPLLTTKKMYWKGIVTELLWFLRGDTNIKYLVDNDCHIWDGDAYKNYERRWEAEGKILSPPLNKFTKEEFINEIKTNWMNARELGDLGPIYGKQWRAWKIIYDNNVSEWVGEGEDAIPIYKVLNRHDQISNLINDLKTNPDSRRLMVNAWNVGELDQMTLPPCHYGFQVYTRELSLNERHRLAEKSDDFENTWNDHQEFDDIDIPRRAISLMWNQRSVDTFLGLPFNIASYGLLLEIIAKEVNMVPDELIGNLGDCHLYKNHIEQAREQLSEIPWKERKEMLTDPSDIRGFGDISPFTDKMINYWLDLRKIPHSRRMPFPLPTLKYTKSLNDVDEVFKNLEVGQFEIETYQSHPTIKAPLSN